MPIHSLISQTLDLVVSHFRDFEIREAKSENMNVARSSVYSSYKEFFDWICKSMIKIIITIIL
jgi:hypothetical protein